MFLRWLAISVDAAMPHLQIRRRQKLAAFGMMCLNTHSAPVPPSPRWSLGRSVGYYTSAEQVLEGGRATEPTAVGLHMSTLRAECTR